MVTSTVCPWAPWLGFTPVIAGGAWSTVKAATRVSEPAALVTETSLAPTAAEPLTVMAAVIWVALSTVKLLTVIPGPKSTAVAPKKSVPVMVTFVVSPWSASVGLTEATPGTAMTMKPFVRLSVPPGAVTRTSR